MFYLIQRTDANRFKPADHIDPEAGYSSGNTGNGIEQSTLPSTRSIGFNLRVGF